MSLTRKFLKEMGIESEKIDLIIDAHAEAVDGLKAERDEWKGKAEKADQLQSELDAMKEQTEGENGWKEKFEKEHSDFEAFKTAQAEKEANSGKEKAFRQMLKDLKISDKVIDSIVRVTDLGSIEIEEDGQMKDLEKHIESVKADYAGFIPEETTSGASIPKPPKTEEPKADLGSLSMADYIQARQKK